MAIILLVKNLELFFYSGTDNKLFILWLEDKIVRVSTDTDTFSFLQKLNFFPSSFWCVSQAVWSQNNASRPRATRCYTLPLNNVHHCRYRFARIAGSNPRMIWYEEFNVLSKDVYIWQDTTDARAGPDSSTEAAPLSCSRGCARRVGKPPMSKATQLIPRWETSPCKLSANEFRAAFVM